jgi:tRNA(fMet)-specific endonuclease VapC
MSSVRVGSPLRYLLDTNTCIRYLNGRAPNVVAKMRATPPQAIAVCSVVKAEMFAGTAKSQNPAKTRAAHQAFCAPFVSLPFDDAAAAAYGPIRADLEKAGQLIGPYDLLIAAIALATQLTLVTHNTGEFSRITGLALEDWEP